MHSQDKEESDSKAQASTFDSASKSKNDVPLVHPSLLLRKIIHIDMDSFYASIEMRDNPSLRNRPIAVGGSPKARGVIATSNYEARRFGVKSAMASAFALRLCPQLLIVKPRMEVYGQVSQQIRAIMRAFTAHIEPLSLDEAYLDVTDCTDAYGQPLFASAIAREIRSRIYNETGLTASAGVAPNKMVAKIASDVNKPNGQKVIVPHEVQAFMQLLPVRRIPFVGPVTEKRLANLGITTCADFARFTIEELERALGAHGSFLFDRARGIDQSPVESTWVRKSLGAEDTFAQDLCDLARMEAELLPLANSVAAGLAEEGKRCRTITLKVKFFDFRQITRSHSLVKATDDAGVLWAIAKQLLQNKTDAAHVPVRLLGVSASNFEIAQGPHSDRKGECVSEIIPSELWD